MSLTKLETRALEHLKILCAAWFIAGDDNRSVKTLRVRPAEYRRWKQLRDELQKREAP